MSSAPVYTIIRSYDLRSDGRESGVVVNWDKIWDQMILDQMIKRNSPDDFGDDWIPTGSGRAADELFGCSGTGNIS